MPPKYTDIQIAEDTTRLFEGAPLSGKMDFWAGRANRNAKAYIRAHKALTDCAQVLEAIDQLQDESLIGQQVKAALKQARDVLNRSS